jgi:hypothetical protein
MSVDGTNIPKELVGHARETLGKIVTMWDRARNAAGPAMINETTSCLTVGTLAVTKMVLMLFDKPDSDGDGNWDLVNRDTDALAAEFAGQVIDGHDPSCKFLPLRGNAGRHFFVVDDVDSLEPADGESLVRAGKAVARVITIELGGLRRKSSDKTSQVLALIAACKIMLALWTKAEAQRNLERYADRAARESMHEVSEAFGLRA